MKPGEILALARTTRAALAEANGLAERRAYREAVRVARKAIDDCLALQGWSSRWPLRILAGTALDELQAKLQTWSTKIEKVDALVARAASARERDGGDPSRWDGHAEARRILAQASKEIADPAIAAAERECAAEIERRSAFASQAEAAREAAEDLRYRDAVTHYRAALALFDSTELRRALEECEAGLDRERQYEARLAEARALVDCGRLAAAEDLLTTAQQAYPREDGTVLLDAVRTRRRAARAYRAGLEAERCHDHTAAEGRYLEALESLPGDLRFIRRLATVCIKQGEFEKAESHLGSCQEPWARYLRGLARANLGRFREAAREWEALQTADSIPLLDLLRNHIQHVQARERVAIEDAVLAGNLAKARDRSLAFRERFGPDEVVDANLEGHILPGLQAESWNRRDWPERIAAAREEWLNSPGGVTLHNWLVALYYGSGNDPETLGELVEAGSALALNIHSDPILADVPWLQGTRPDATMLAEDLMAAIDARVEVFRESAPEVYLQLRDRSRVESLARSLMKHPPPDVPSVCGLLLPPGAASRMPTNGQGKRPRSGSDRKPEVLMTLYTPWGRAVAACLEGDIERARFVAPRRSSGTVLEDFAAGLVACHEALFALKHHQWRQAIPALQKAKTLARSEPGFFTMLDDALESLRPNLSGLEDQLALAQAWYDSIGGRRAATFLADCKAREVGTLLADETIGREVARRRLHEILRIDGDCASARDLLRRLALVEDAERIGKLVEAGRLDAAVTEARRSPHREVKAMIAEYCMEILTSEIRYLDPGSILQLATWAHDLCPDDPQIRDAYHTVRRNLRGISYL